MLCTVHFGFVSPFFCPFVENWPLLSTLLLYVYLIIVLLFYYYLGLSWLYLVFFFFLRNALFGLFFLFCFIWSYMGLKEKLSSYYLIAWATLFLILFFQVLNSNYSAKCHCNYNSYISFFSNLLVFFSPFKYLWKLVYILLYWQNKFHDIFTIINVHKCAKVLYLRDFGFVSHFFFPSFEQ